MVGIFIYLIKVVISSALFVGVYWCLLRKGRFYQWNRFYILASVILSIIIPALDIPISSSLMTVPLVSGYATTMSIEPAIVNASALPVASPIPWAWLGFMLCLSVACFLLIKELIAFIRILRLKHSSELMHTPETELYCTDDAAAPFTFFRAIFWKKGFAVDSGAGACMLRHELAHVRLGHSWDKALMQLVCCLFWTNPFFILFRRELELVHEFAADSESLDKGNAEELSSLILCTLYPNHYRDFTSRFYQSSIKRRIIMIKENKRLSMNMLRKMSIIPIALFAMYLFSFSNKAIAHVKDDAVTEIVYEQPSEVKSEELEQTKTTTANEQTSEETIPVALVEVKPMFQGGDEHEFSKWVFENLTYPQFARDNNIQGRVICSFVVASDGSVIDVKILRGVAPSLDEEALRVINMSPKWTPGKQKGKAVNVKYTFPIIFQLNSKSKDNKEDLIQTEIDIVKEETSEEAISLALAEVKPMFQGGDEHEFTKWVFENLTYPQFARDSSIQGRVICSFVVASDGSVVDVKILRGVDPSLDEEALRVINMSPKWTPGKQKGKAVRVKYTFPIDFKM